LALGPVVYDINDLRDPCVTYYMPMEKGRVRGREKGKWENMEIRLFLMRDRYGNLYMKGLGQAGTTGVDSFIEGESR
jgi:hypothetical protein